MNSNVSEMASCEVLLKNQERPSQRRPRPLTFAEFGADLKPYFTTYQDPERPSSFLELGLDVEKESSTFDTRVGKVCKQRMFHFVCEINKSHKTLKDCMCIMTWFLAQQKPVTHSHHRHFRPHHVMSSSWSNLPL